MVDVKIKNMNAHKIEFILTEDGTLTLQGLPFHAGEALFVKLHHVKYIIK